MKKSKSVLISKELGKNPLIKQWCNDQEISLIEKSFITFQGLPGKSIPTTDWVFFSSPNSVELYFQHYQLKARQIAAYSDGTSRALMQAGYSPDFIGDITKSPKQIGADFLSILHPESTVFFPISNLSKKSIYRVVSKVRSCSFEVTYTTLLAKESLVDLMDILIFTSPSNLEGFLRKNKIADCAILIAIGDTTAEAIKDLKITNQIFISKEPNEKGLLEVLKSAYACLS
jgi:uroporphyrinogen-III synthase